MRLSSTWTLAVLVIGLVLAGAAVNGGFAADATNQTVEDEAVTVDYDSPVAVSPPANTVELGDNVSVENTTRDALVRGTDYEWSGGRNGSVDFINTSATSSGGDAFVSYNASTASDADAGAADTLGVFGKVGALAVLVAGAAAALRFGTGGSF